MLTCGRPRIIILWSSPRSRSTAFFRYMLERDDLVALHEPFGDLADHGETDIGNTTVSSEREVIAVVRDLARSRTVFIKDTTDHWYRDVIADLRFLAEVTHTFLIRHPAAIAPSFYALDKTMRRKDIGLEFAYDIYLMARSVRRERPVIVDSDDLIDRPAATVAAYCAGVGLPFLPQALTWKPGVRREWRTTARWHVAASNSSGFEPMVRDYPITSANDAKLAAYCAYHMPFYERLRAERLRVSRD